METAVWKINFAFYNRISLNIVRYLRKFLPITRHHFERLRHADKGITNISDSRIDGTAVTAGVNMKNVLFILAGAFENMEINREIERNRHPVGFMNGAEDEGEDTAGAESPGSYDLEAELRRKNISRELLGRITHIVHMDAIDRDAMREILIDPDNGVLTGWKKRFEASGLSLIIENDQVIEGILDNVMNKNVGARGIRKIVESMIGMYRYDMLEKGYQVMVLHPGMFEGEPPKFYQERTCESILRPEHFRARNPEKNIR